MQEVLFLHFFLLSEFVSYPWLSIWIIMKSKMLILLGSTSTVFQCQFCRLYGLYGLKMNMGVGLKMGNKGVHILVIVVGWKILVFE